MQWTWKVSWVVGTGLLVAWMVAAVYGSDFPIISVSRGALAPDRVEVHVGEVVQWRAKAGVRIRLEFDAHRDAHEVIVRSGEIRAVFRQPGQHWYVASIIGDGHRHARGVVIVLEADQDLADFPLCAPESSVRLCFQP